MSVRWEVEESATAGRADLQRQARGALANYLVSPVTGASTSVIACDIIEPRYLATQVLKSLARDRILQLTVS